MPSHARSVRGCLLAALLLVACVAGAAPAPLPAFAAHYEVLRDGGPIGVATLTLAPGMDGAWTFTTATRGTSGLAGLIGARSEETSVFHWVGRLPQCDRYDYHLDAGFKDRQRTVRCDWRADTIVVNDRGTYRYATVTGALERHTVPLALAAGLAAGQRNFALPVAVKDRIQVQHYAAQTRASITVPAGTFNAIRVVRTGGGHPYEAWFVPGKLPVPIKIDRHGKHDLALVLQRWTDRPAP